MNFIRNQWYQGQKNPKNFCTLNAYRSRLIECKMEWMENSHAFCYEEMNEKFFFFFSFFLITIDLIDWSIDLMGFFSKFFIFAFPFIYSFFFFLVLTKWHQFRSSSIYGIGNFVFFLFLFISRPLDENSTGDLFFFSWKFKFFFRLFIFFLKLKFKTSKHHGNWWYLITWWWCEKCTFDCEQKSNVFIFHFRFITWW